jgi:hypothetical protein
MDDSPVLEELSRRLWDERQIVTYLLFKLTVTKLLLSADERRFVPDALAEVERTVELLRDGEVARETALRAVAGAWHVGHELLTMDVLVAKAPNPYSDIFREHRNAFQELAEEIETVARSNRELATTEFEHLNETIEALTGVTRAEPSTYDASGRLDNTAKVGGHLRKVL